ncbi:hypothetical protein QBZ16_002054 [Prototheca wickerhamii]|uniref:Uncharacterized protein n=1 Tax=Prototheca wickerhamii TaxID=3111 RepID=A0AAD9IM34_PROWI|nr:hypothetical protein QBZ16_002054 [Prototheca wickerhamii]
MALEPRPLETVARTGHSFAPAVGLPCEGADSLVAMAHDDGVGIADVFKPALLATLPSPPKAGLVTSLLAAPHAEAVILLVGHEDGSLAVWSIAPGSLQTKLLARRQLSKEPLLALAYCPQQEAGVAAGPLANLLPFKLSLGGTNCLALRSDGRLLAAGGWDGRVRVFEFPSCRPLATLKYHVGDAVTAVAWGSPARGLLATSSCTGSVALYRLYPTADALVKDP